MKKIIISPLFCFALLSLYAQGTWNVQINNCWPYHLINTHDGNLLLVGRNVTVLPGFNKQSHYMIKYNLDGEVLWEKEHDFGFSDTSVGNSGGVYAISSFVQAPSNNFISSGTYHESGVSYCYNFITNTQGDSLFFQKFVSGSADCISPRYVFNNKIYSIKTNSSTGYKYAIEIDENLEIINETILENSNEYSARSIIDQDLNVYTKKSEGGGARFRKYSIDGDLQLEETHDKPCDLMAINTEGYLTCYDKSLLQLNDDLSIRWFTPKEDLIDVPSSLGPHERFIVPTDDGGLILGGDIGDSFLSVIYLVKVDSEGVKEWHKSYIEFPLTEMLGLVAVEDGYVLAAYSGTLSNLWLVKLNEQGLLLSTEEADGFTQDRYFDIYPNPAYQTVNIQFREAFSGSLLIYNVEGQRMFQATLYNEQSFSHAVEGLPSGIYIVQLLEEKTGKAQSAKFAKY